RSLGISGDGASCRGKGLDHSFKSGRRVHDGRHAVLRRDERDSGAFRFGGLEFSGLGLGLWGLVHTLPPGSTATPSGTGGIPAHSARSSVHAVMCGPTCAFSGVHETRISTLTSSSRVAN